MRLIKLLFVFIFIFAGFKNAFSQEYTVPYLYHPKVCLEYEAKSKLTKRTEPITLPLIETFDYYSSTSLPSDEWWIDQHVYVNNHFTNNQKNKGIATFDVINKEGSPYTDMLPWAQLYCDSLTSFFIDLSEHNVGDSLYLSFDYASGGLGFKPKPSDSLLIYFKDSANGWAKVGQIVADASMEWKTIMLPITNPDCFYGEFQFRIINKGTIGYSGSHWHIDNVVLDEGRRYNDTEYINLAMSIEPSSFLKDFTSMPWKHYNTDKALFTADSISCYTHLVHNLTTFLDANVSYQASLNGGTVISSSTSTFTHLLGGNNRAGFTNFSPSLLSGTSGIENTLLINYSLVPPTDDAYDMDNSIQSKVLFSNYMSYDDGNCEQAYFLNLSPGLRGEVAVEYACYVPDTLTGIQVQFIPQVPNGVDKEFYIRIYKNITVGSSEAELIYEQGGNYPIYTRDNNGIVTYPLDELVPLGVGQFYVSIMMPASGISDSLLIGLDVQRSGGNHRYFNVLDTWESSLIDGAIVLRPVFGGRLLSNENHSVSQIALYPNPTDEKIYFSGLPHQEMFSYKIFDALGRLVITEENASESIDVKSLTSGQYFILIFKENAWKKSFSFIKK